MLCLNFNAFTVQGLFKYQNQIDSSPFSIEPSLPYLFCEAAIRAFSSIVRGPVLRPPWSLHHAFRGRLICLSHTTGARQRAYHNISLTASAANERHGALEITDIATV